MNVLIWGSRHSSASVLERSAIFRHCLQLLLLLLSWFISLLGILISLLGILLLLLALLLVLLALLLVSLLLGGNSVELSILGSLHTLGGLLVTEVLARGHLHGTEVFLGLGLDPAGLPVT